MNILNWVNSNMEISIGITGLIIFVLNFLIQGLDEGESDDIFMLFSINKIASFMMGFGATFQEFQSRPIAFVGGFLTALALHLMIRMSRKNDDSVTENEKVNVEVGQIVQAYTPISKNNGNVMVFGRVISAMTSDNDIIDSGTKVKVTGINIEGTLTVTKEIN